MEKFYTRQQVGSAVRKAMERSNLRQADLARLLEIPQQAVSQAVNGAFVSPKIAEWLGFESAKGLYRRKQVKQ